MLLFLFVLLVMAKTLFDKYGGVPMATRVAKDFHERLMRRPHLRRYFLEIPIDRIIQHHGQADCRIDVCATNTSN